MTFAFDITPEQAEQFRKHQEYANAVKRVVPRDDPILQANYLDIMERLGWPEVVECNNGTCRFRKNTLIRWLVDQKKVDLCELSAAQQNGEFTIDEHMLFYVGLGYSLCGFSDVFGDEFYQREEEFGGTDG